MWQHSISSRGSPYERRVLLCSSSRDFRLCTSCALYFTHIKSGWIPTSQATNQNSPSKKSNNNRILCFHTYRLNSPSFSFVWEIVYREWNMFNRIMFRPKQNIRGLSVNLIFVICDRESWKWFISSSGWLRIFSLVHGKKVILRSAIIWRVSHGTHVGYVRLFIIPSRYFEIWVFHFWD